MRFVLLGVAALSLVVGVCLACTVQRMRAPAACYLSTIAFSFWALAVP
jgi:hypothetical protein